MTHWTDDPLTRDVDDQLDRLRIADRVASVIESATSASTSSVFGLVGPWGDGKSTLINFVENRLSPSWKIAHVTPWATSSVDDLLTEFFAAIASALPDDMNPEKSKRRKFLGYVSIATPLLSAIPVVGAGVKETGGALLDRLTQQKPWVDRFREASSILRQLDTPVLVVADDVDRLDAPELMALLKAIRLLGRFPGVHYLLAYDQETLVQVLRRSGMVGDDERRALAYLEKIVQYPLPVPPASRARLDRLLNQGLRDVISGTGHRLDDDGQRRFATAYEDLLAGTLTTVRAVQRFLANARAYLPLLDPDEVDVVDLLLLIHLRMLAPKLHAALSAWESDLTGRFNPSRLLGPKDDRIDWSHRIRSRDVPEDLVVPVRTVLEDIFPAMGGRSISYRDDNQCRARDPDYFPRYFAFGVPADNDIPDMVVREALLEASHAERAAAIARFNAVAAGANEELGFLAIRKAQRLSEALDASAVPTLIDYVAELVPMLPSRSAFTGDTRQAGVVWLARLLQRLSAPLDAGHIDRLATSAGLDAFANALMEATKASANVSDPLGQATSQIVARARQVIIEHLGARDEAPAESVMALFELVRAADPYDKLAIEIIAGLDDKRWTIDDVAARFVGAAWSSNTPDRLELHFFHAEMLLTVVPQSSKYVVDLPPDGAAPDVYDTSWASRRRFARQHLSNLPTDPPETTTVESS